MWGSSAGAAAPTAGTAATPAPATPAAPAAAPRPGAATGARRLRSSKWVSSSESSGCCSSAVCKVVFNDSDAL